MPRYDFENRATLEPTCGGLQIAMVSLRIERCRSEPNRRIPRVAVAFCLRGGLSTRPRPDAGSVGRGFSARASIFVLHIFMNDNSRAMAKRGSLTVDFWRTSSALHIAWLYRDFNANCNHLRWRPAVDAVPNLLY
jgi:hypothetical protein